MEIFVFLGVFFAGLLAILLFTKKGRVQADYVLAVWLVVVTIHLFAYFSYVSGIIFKHDWLINLALPYPFFHGPFLYLYVRSLSSEEPLELKHFLTHFLLPFGLIMSEIPILTLPPELKKALMLGNDKTFDIYFTFQSILLNISGIFYVIVTYLLLRKHKKNVLQKFSAKEKITLDWLQFLYYSMTGLWVLIIFIQRDELIFGGASLFVLFMGYFGLRQPSIFRGHNDTNLVEEVIETLTVPDSKYSKSGLSPEMSLSIHQSLVELMKEEKPFLQPELSLKELSGLLDVNPNYLSQVINEREGLNFYDYINGQRAEHFKALIRQGKGENYTLLALAYESGFNSKATFNRFFKKHSGLSPSEFLNNATQE
ncbi:MAG: AraC family transcriptional regulator [Saprospiraceae bacterium]|nr:AraC family transcriptional regulator [Saprospiraceae bacterium]